MAPVDELAELLMERHEGWSEDDFEGEDPDDGEPLVSDAAWGRVIGEKRAELARLVKEGILQGSGTGKRLRVNAGSFYGWLGEEAPVYPDWGSEFEVFPDTERERVEGTRRLRRRAQEAIMASPSHSGVIRQIMRKSGSPPPWGDELVERLEAALRRNFEQRWQELVAVEKVLDEVAAEFDGEDPLEPEVRETLVGIRAELEELFDQMAGRIDGFPKKEEPREEHLSDLRSAVFGDSDPGSQRYGPDTKTT
ncbi:MAG: hypothetical protein WD379_06640 [Dehalococcoidia bacterium]